MLRCYVIIRFEVLSESLSHRLPLFFKPENNDSTFGRFSQMLTFSSSFNKNKTKQKNLISFFFFLCTQRAFTCVVRIYFLFSRESLLSSLRLDEESWFIWLQFLAEIRLREIFSNLEFFCQLFGKPIRWRPLEDIEWHMSVANFFCKNGHFLKWYKNLKSILWSYYNYVLHLDKSQ